MQKVEKETNASPHRIRFRSRRESMMQSSAGQRADQAQAGEIRDETSPECRKTQGRNAVEESRIDEPDARCSVDSGQLHSRKRHGLCPTGGASDRIANSSPVTLTFRHHHRRYDDATMSIRFHASAPIVTL